MKRCPLCHRTYNDKKRQFCLTDGALLSTEYDPEGILQQKRQPIVDDSEIKFPLELFRVYCLFGYERDGARESVLWNDPGSFHRLARERGERLRRDYDLWKLTKRNFSPNELLDGKWVKIADHGQKHHFELHRDGTLTESPLFSFDVDDRWTGKWKLIEGVLRLTVSSVVKCLPDRIRWKEALHRSNRTASSYRCKFYGIGDNASSESPIFMDGIRTRNRELLTCIGSGFPLRVSQFQVLQSLKSK